MSDRALRGLHKYYSELEVDISKRFPDYGALDTNSIAYLNRYCKTFIYIGKRLNTLLYHDVLLNHLPESIADLSSLTRIQVETIKIHQAVRKGEINMDNALRSRINVGISRGTHYRILAQAKKNVVESLFTLAVAVQMGLVKSEDVGKLISSVSMIPVDIDDEKLPEVMDLAKVLADRIVML